jgi:hypothetical protein
MDYAPDVKNRRLQVVVDAIGADGLVKIGTQGMGTLLSVVRLQTPAFTVSGGEMNLAGKANLDPRARDSGLARTAQITTASGKVIVDDLTVGASDAEIILTSDEIKKGMEVRIAFGTIVHG